MIELEVDGKKVEVPEGSMVMHAAQKAGVYVPHFCYHKKLSIAANCRMCLVEVEKVPKVLPACATPVSAGMVVHTHSEKAKLAQKSVMEFLLINHPLDCPICDQGGECQLQDLAVGYGGNQSRYQEEKRIVFHKNVGPLISMEEMSRCIHCTRCVRFGQEVAGKAELGMLHRGEHSEITAFVGQTVDSELSGNMIDLCPVGALTSKPFRYVARTWELSRRRSISAHDSLGSHLVVQIKGQEVKRVLPLENELINECWLSDRDRFAYEGLNHVERATVPMIKKDGQWIQVGWDVALTQAVEGLQGVAHEHGADSLVALLHGNSTTEEMYLLNELWKQVGSNQIDFRLRQANVATCDGVPHLGVAIAEFGQLDHLLLVGSILRHEQPLLAARLRQSQSAVSRVSNIKDDPLLVKNQLLDLIDHDMVRALHAIIKAVASHQNIPIPGFASAEVEQNAVAIQIADRLVQSPRNLISVGQQAIQSVQSDRIFEACQWLKIATKAQLGWFGESANTAGGYWVKAYRDQSPINSNSEKQKGFLLFGIEPDQDVADPYRLLQTLNHSQFTVALSAYVTDTILATSQVILPITPFTETSGTFVNIQGSVQSFQGVSRAKGQSRPGWKVLQAIANIWGYSEINFESTEAIMQIMQQTNPLKLSDNFVFAQKDVKSSQLSSEYDSQLIASVAPYCGDPIVRRSASLQATKVGDQSRKIGVSQDLWIKLQLSEGSSVKLQQKNHPPLVADVFEMKGLPSNSVWMQLSAIPNNMLSSCESVKVERI